MKKFLLTFSFLFVFAFAALAQCTSAVTSINNSPVGPCVTQLTTTNCAGPMFTLCTNGCIQLTANMNPNVNVVGLQWLAGSINVTVQSPTSASTQVCANNVTGPVTLILQVVHDNVCQTVVTCTLNVVVCTGQYELLQNISDECKLFPNPAQDKVTFEVPYTLNNASIKIFNMLGENVLATSQTIENNSAIDVAHLAKGMYIIEIKTESAIIRKYIVKS